VAELAGVDCGQASRFGTDGWSAGGGRRVASEGKKFTWSLASCTRLGFVLHHLVGYVYLNHVGSKFRDALKFASPLYFTSPVEDGFLDSSNVKVSFYITTPIIHHLFGDVLAFEHVNPNL
jgi:hypothetical protein